MGRTASQEILWKPNSTIIVNLVVCLRHRKIFTPSYAVPVDVSSMHPSAMVNEQEDLKMTELVGLFGPKRWSAISQRFPGRIGKQCRERSVTPCFASCGLTYPCQAFPQMLF